MNFEDKQKWTRRRQLFVLYQYNGPYEAHPPIYLLNLWFCSKFNQQWNILSSSAENDINWTQVVPWITERIRKLKLILFLARFSSKSSVIHARGCKIMKTKKKKKKEKASLDENRKTYVLSIVPLDHSDRIRSKVTRLKILVTWRRCLEENRLKSSNVLARYSIPSLSIERRVPSWFIALFQRAVRPVGTNNTDWPIAVLRTFASHPFFTFTSPSLGQAVPTGFLPDSFPLSARSFHVNSAFHIGRIHDRRRQPVSAGD